VNEFLKQIEDWVLGFESDFEAFKVRLEKDLAKVEASVLRRVLADVVPLISQDGGYFKAGVLNLSKANLIERVFDEIGKDELRPVLTTFAEELLAVSGKNAAYYLLTGQDETKVQAIAKDLSLIRGVIGIDTNGELLNNGYLSRLGRSEAVREQLKGYLLTSIATKQKVSDFERGLRFIISGNAEVNGALVGYWRQYAYDTYARVREVDNLHFADELGMDDFVYQGGITLCDLHGSVVVLVLALSGSHLNQPFVYFGLRHNGKARPVFVQAGLFMLCFENRLQNCERRNTNLVYASLGRERYLPVLKFCAALWHYQISPHETVNPGISAPDRAVLR